MAQDKQTFPRTLIFGAGVTGGVLLAIVAQVLLGRLGLDLAAVWRELFPTRAAQMRSAFAWWLVAGISFLGGLAFAAFVKYFSGNWWQLRVVRWVAAALLVGGLAEVGRVSAEPSGLAASANVLVNLAVLVLSGVLAMLGAYFVVRR
jgi:hypothetical protein